MAALTKPRMTVRIDEATAYEPDAQVYCEAGASYNRA
jgi:hypothetical protein